MITVEEMQTVGAFVTLLFGIFVAVTPVRDTISLRLQNRVFNKSRWLLASGLVLFCVHFLLQRFMGFRSMGVSQAVAVNILFLKPAVLLVNLSVLNLLAFGKLRAWHTRLAVGIVALTYALLAVAALTSEGGLQDDSTMVRLMEMVSSTVTGAGMLAYNVDAWKRYRRISVALDDYYDSPQQSVIRWFAVSAFLFAILAILTPVTTYTTSAFVLQLHGFTAFGTIAFLVLSFLRYGAENSMMLLMPVEAEAQVTDASVVTAAADAADLPRDIDEKVKRWIEEDRHLRAGITAGEMASELGITRDELKLYIQRQGYPKIGSWLAYHRIEHAKMLMRTYHNYNHDAIALMCGFSSRQYFQKCFKDVEGVPPLYWQKNAM